MITKQIGRVVGVYTGKHEIVSEAVPRLRVTPEGVFGDRHFGYTKLSGVREKQYPKGTLIRNNRQWSAVSQEELTDIAKELGIRTIQPEWLGANLLLTGIDRLTQLPPCSRLHFSGGPVLLVYGGNIPCKHPADIMRAKASDLSEEAARRFVKVAMDRRGLVGCVEREGEICVGDTVTVHLP